MKKFKKLILMFVVPFIFVFIMPLSVSANAPMPADYLTVAFSNLPEEAVYADLLIKISEKDSNYIDFQSNAFATDPSNVKEIVDYSSDGYRSFTFHYKNAKSNIKIEYYFNKYYSVDFCNGSEYREYLTQYESLLKDYRDVKIALLDKDFNIIDVSKETQLPKESNFILFYGRIFYDFSNDSFDIETRVNSFFIVFGSLFLSLFIMISVGTELIVGLLFRFKGKQLLSILIVNMCSQIIMRILYIVLPFAYLIETVVFEITVYGAEFLIYRKCFKETATAKIVSYTLIANTLSLLLGIILDCYILV